MTSGEVDVALGVLGRGTVAVTLRPGPALFLQRPPDAHILGGLDPRGVLDLARVIEVQRHAREQDIGSRAADDHGTPRRHTGVPHPHFIAIFPGHEVGLERCSLMREIHGRVVGEIGIHDGHVESIVHLQGDRTRHVALLTHGLTGIDALVVRRQGRNRPRLGVAGQSELGCLVHDHKVLQTSLARELVAESDTVVKGAEHHAQLTFLPALFLQHHAQLVVTVAHLSILAPRLAPGLVERCTRHLAHLEVVLEVAVLEHKAQSGTIDNGLTAAHDLVPGLAAVNTHGHRERPVGRTHLHVLSTCHRAHCQANQGKKQKSFHFIWIHLLIILFTNANLLYQVSMDLTRVSKSSLFKARALSLER